MHFDSLHNARFSASSLTLKRQYNKHIITMATVFRGLLQPIWQPQMTSIRLRTRINFKKPRPPHFTRAKVEELCKPKFPKHIVQPLYELCEGPSYQKMKPENPYEILLSKEALNWFRKHKYIFFFHLNSMTTTEYLEMQVMLKKCGVVVRRYGRKTLEHSFVGTMYEPVLCLFHSHTLIGFGNDVNLSALLSGLKKTRSLLLAGIIDDRLLSVSEIKYCSTLPDLPILRATLVSLLNSTAANVVQHLNHHPTTLVHHLKEYVKLSKEDDN